ncbi:MAG: hypothetical protein D6681_07170 [Calditrichaeota bacterium]|nr:MAG: hypothetical protein D6681_07170 [Calditrichota bacterium]
MEPLVTALLFGIYNLLIIPLLVAGLHIVAMFNSRYREGLLGRYRWHRAVRNFCRKNPPASGEIFLFHCASLGEFEHIKPLLRHLKDADPHCKIVVMFFSPSGYRHAGECPAVDLFIYTPIDWWLPMYRLYRLLRPRALVIAKHDVWANQVWMARLMGIPCFLINATLYASSGQLHPLMRFFQRAVYRRFTRILAISEADRALLEKLAPGSRIAVVGDTKYDQVVQRSRESQRKKVLPEAVVAGRRVFVAGSIWPEDERQLIPALKTLREAFPDLCLILCPHEPTPEHIGHLRRQWEPQPVCCYSELTPNTAPPVIIIDRVGILANLYAAAQAAYVGGGFKQNVHNILEPAVYGIPVFFGPVNANSREAQWLKERCPEAEVHDAGEIEARLRKVFTEERYRKELGNAARGLVYERAGATPRVAEEIRAALQA